MPLRTSSLIYLDLFGFKPRLYFKGYYHSFTKTGLCLSFLMIVFSFFCFFYFGQDLYFKRNPTVIYNEDFISYPKPYILDPEQEPVIVEINNPVGDEFYTDPKYLSVIVSQVILIKVKGKEPQLTIQDYLMDKCSEDHFKNIKNLETRDWFINRNLGDYFCIPSKVKNLTMEGAFDQEVYKAIRFSFILCNNATSNNTCESREKIKNKIRSGFFGVYFVDNIIDPGEYDKYIRANPHESFSNWDVSASKEQSIYFKTSHIHTDDGALQDNTQDILTRTYDGEDNFQFIEEKDDFLVIYLRMSHKEVHYKRKYQKIQNLLAQVGGFINCFWILGFALNYLNSHLIFIRDIVKDVFSIKELDESDLESLSNKFTKGGRTIKSKQSTKIFKLETSKIAINSGNDSWTTEPGAKSNKIHPAETKLQNFAKETNKNSNDLLKLNMNLTDMIYFYTGWFTSPERKQKKAIILKGMNIIKEHLDVKCIIQKFFDIEKIKQIVLDDKQLNTFNNIGKPQLELAVMKGNVTVRTNVLSKQKTNTYNQKIKNKKENN